MLSNRAAALQLGTFFDQQQNSGLWPKLQDVHVAANVASIDLYVPPDLKWFTGHFPDQPVLPGIVQIHWAALVGAELLSRQAELSKMTRLKFKSMVAPETSLTLQLKIDQIQNKLAFRYAQSEREFSSGTLFLDQ